MDGLPDGLDIVTDLFESLRLPAGFSSLSDVASSYDEADGEDGALTKVVLARRTTVDVTGRVRPADLLQMLQQRDPSAYHLILQPSAAAPALVACTPERLYARKSTAPLAGCLRIDECPRLGAVDENAADLLLSEKEHREFVIVRESVRGAMASICTAVDADIEKTLLKQSLVQHLYARFRGQLPAVDTVAAEFQLVAALQPTPAVSGHPKLASLAAIAHLEPFDRGFYAGPVGWVGAGGADFAIAIRSALLSTLRGGGTSLSVFAGVGVVKGSDPESEWRELDLKASQYMRLLALGAPPAGGGRSSAPESWAGQALSRAPNSGAAWATAIIEECVRHGVSYFCLAPGSRSSPLALAATAHPRARVLVCFDERSLGFHAVGYGRGNARGAPAAVITSSGTAVSELLPAVVEASQSCVPLLLLTADRPPELWATGANQTIDQVNHFGSAVRFSFVLPPPPPLSAADKAGIPLRMALTTVDHAIARSMGPDAGPVHLNCCFREPLAPVEEGRDGGGAAFLHGLGAGSRWDASGLPFTRYSSGDGGEVGAEAAAEVAALVRQARRGMVVAGNLAREEDAWAVAALTSFLGWPLIADAASGLRIGAAAGAGHPCLVPFFDHVLLAGEEALSAACAGLGGGRADAAAAFAPDVVLQFGGRLTSKRVAQLLEEPSGMQRVVVDPAPSMRHDPAHTVALRVTATPRAMASALLERLPPPTLPPSHGGKARRAWTPYAQVLRALSDAVGRAIAASLAEIEAYGPEVAVREGGAGSKVDGKAGGSLTEPTVARIVAAGTPAGHGLFLGNSMPIRDLDFYAPTMSAQLVAELGAPVAAAAEVGAGLKVGANRGASGIDGVLSAASGFAVGSRRPTTLLIGDLSFLHDSAGGLLILGGAGGAGAAASSQAGPADVLNTAPAVAVTASMADHPVTVVVVNNSGGGIFSFLPVANAVPSAQFSTVFTTPQAVDIASLCRAHGVPHSLVSTVTQLEDALAAAHQGRRHTVIEVQTRVDENVAVHRAVQRAAVSAARKACFAVAAVSGHVAMSVLGALSLAPYSLQLSAPATVVSAPMNRRGILLELAVQGPGGHMATGCGEVAPLQGVHAETFEDALLQLRAIATLRPFHGTELSPTAFLLDGSLNDYLVRALGRADTAALLPSVRCGLECALLSAMASYAAVGPAGAAVSPRDLMVGHASGPGWVRVCGLVDGVGGKEEVVQEARRLVAMGFDTLKLKVARRPSPAMDAQVVAAVRRAVGPLVAIRVDANRRWSLADATAFAAGLRAAACAIEYIEEPVANPLDLAAFFSFTGIRIALDETVDEGLLDGGRRGAELPLGPRQGVVALVVKPARVGGWERVSALAQWAAQHGLRLVVSAAFEWDVALASYVQLAGLVDAMGVFPQAAAAGPSAGFGAPAPASPPSSAPEAVQSSPSTVHGLGTSVWLPAEASRFPLRRLPPEAGAGGMGVSVSECAGLLRAVPPFDTTAADTEGRESSDTFIVPIDGGDVKYDFAVRRFRSTAAAAMAAAGAEGAASPLIVLLHGMFGCKEDWAPVVAGLSVDFDCLTVDLPGHGATRCEGVTACGFERVCDALAELLDVMASGQRRVVLVGYSLGARIALSVACRQPRRLAGVVSISGSAGLEDARARLERAAHDDRLAGQLRHASPAAMRAFLESWYRQPMWASLRAHPRFAGVMAQRLGSGAGGPLADALSGMSVGRQPPLWADLPALAVPVLFVAGELDRKFVAAARRMGSLVAGASLEPPKSVDIEDELLELVAQLGMDKPLEPLALGDRDGGVDELFGQIEGQLAGLIGGGAAEETRPAEAAAPAQAAVQVLAGAGHALHIEAPLALLPLLRNFAAARRVNA